MDWTEVLGRRDRLATLLRPHLGKTPARERANDIIQALLCADEVPAEVALRMLARDLEPRAAQVVAYQIGRAWEAPTAAAGLAERPADGTSPASKGLSSLTGAVGARFVRPRRETMILGLWN